MFRLQSHNDEVLQQALEKSRRSPEEHFVHLGWIDAEGRVTTLLGGTSDPEPSAANQPDDAR